MSKVAIIILSDPQNGGEEAFGRAFNGLAAAWDIKQSGGEVTVTFQGTGTRWPGLIAQADHPLNGLYGLVKGSIEGVSCGCADAFGAAESAAACGMKAIKDNPVPSTPGLASIAKKLKFGTNVLIF